VRLELQARTGGELTVAAVCVEQSRAASPEHSAVRAQEVRGPLRQLASSTVEPRVLSTAQCALKAVDSTAGCMPPAVPLQTDT
jgi:hypothetical protein